jgi:hypothetical protein
VSFTTTCPTRSHSLIAENERRREDLTGTASGKSGRDDAHDAQGLAAFQRPFGRISNGLIWSPQTGGILCGHPQAVGGCGDLLACLGQGLTVLEGEVTGKIVASAHERVGGKVQAIDSFVEGERPETSERVAGLSDGSFNFGFTVVGNLREDFAGHRTPHDRSHRVLLGSEPT